MDTETLGAALEREHREIDGGIEAFTASGGKRQADLEPLIRAMAGLRRHIYLEEQFLFPPIRDAGMIPPIMVMLREHGELWESMDLLESALHADPETPDVQDLCRELLAKLASHNSKEEPIIYPQADRILSAEASTELRAFLDSGQMPEGWVCERAPS
ncbi:hemerythrin HHE cation binding domain-containing protein [Antricoccus suffuscus]|uniref:Hemerythrin HHE cation binding domain-containing protein n=1 Tax=Antricoccus suffuscus TaxID=1629062 RepID=A0A2T0ZY43_9ACTN|nr:hemerythrin domain-containing protein [Antricoccus suffuscus]PRZ41253.1 hemerythrin HHE cation binding domain-containing protein [Antricoccus suffuscus]